MISPARGPFGPAPPVGRLTYALIIAVLTACSSESTGPTGTLQISVNLSGNSSDEDGVTILAVPQEGTPIVSDVTTTAGQIALEVSPGSYDVSLGDVADNCWTDSEEMSVTVSDGVPTPVTFDITCIGEFAYTYSGSLFYVDGEGTTREHPTFGTFIVHEWNPSRGVILVEELTALGDPVYLFDVASVTLTRIGAVDFSYSTPDPIWSPSGDSLVVGRARTSTDPAEDEAIVVYDPTGTTPLDSVVGPRPQGMAWRPGTDQIAYTTGTEIRLRSFGDGVDSPLAASTGDRIVWSPDGSRLAVEVSGAEGQQIVVLDDQGDELFRVGGIDNGMITPVWAPDGSGLLFVGGPGPEVAIYYVSADGSNEHKISTESGGDSQPSWAPDGDYFIYTAVREGQTGLRLGNLLGLPHRKLVPRGAGPRFRPGTALGLDQDPL